MWHDNVDVTSGEQSGEPFQSNLIQIKATSEEEVIQTHIYVQIVP